MGDPFDNFNNPLWFKVRKYFKVDLVFIYILLWRMYMIYRHVKWDSYQMN